MPPSGDVAVVIPARNESDRIEATVAGAAGLPGVDLVIVVDDGSADDTAAIAATFPFRLLRLPHGGLSRARNAGIQALVRDLNRLYRSLPALHELDCEDAGFEWVVSNDADHSVFAWMRQGKEPRSRCLVVVNFTPQVHTDYRIKVPFVGTWREVLNTDAIVYGGSGVGNGGSVNTLNTGPIPEVSLVIPPLAAIFLVPEV